MIIADFYKNPDNSLAGFRITGHAGFADEGEDICCASVSSAVMMTANTITDVFIIKAEIGVDENEINLRLENDDSGNGDKLILGLITHLYNMSEEFPNRIKVRVISTSD